MARAGPASARQAAGASVRGAAGAGAGATSTDEAKQHKLGDLGTCFLIGFVLFKTLIKCVITPLAFCTVRPRGGTAPHNSTSLGRFISKVCACASSTAVTLLTEHSPYLSLFIAIAAPFVPYVSLHFASSHLLRLLPMPLLLRLVRRSTTRSDPLYHKDLRGQFAPNPRFVKMVDLRGY